MKYFMQLLLLLVILNSCKEKNSEEKIELPKIQKEQIALKSALTLYASFDNGIDADVANGDSKLYSVMNRKELDSALIGLHKDSVNISKNQGKYGDALQFKDKSKGYIYYRSLNNIAYSKTDWSSSISFWLSLDPNKDLKPGYCDPIQITDSGYNDAGIWVDFTKENPRDFRLGVIGDRDSWNPNPEGPDNENPNFISQLIPVENPPFASGIWTHIVINFSNLNTEKGKTELFINGKNMGSRASMTDPFTWEIEKSNILLGLSYIGLMDELSIFNRALSNDEIETLYNSKEPISNFIN
ncbi:MAG: LamG domain-containing protein [Winogradskyella sp.]|nr:MAG: LamG domain-containing protein [Winogradskyella sp.]